MQKKLVEMLLLIGQRTIGSMYLKNYVRSMVVMTTSERRYTK